MRHRVPQGSGSGPLLFLIYNNELSNYQLDPNLILFVNDTTNMIKLHPNSPLDYEISNIKTNIQKRFVVNTMGLNEANTHNINFFLWQVQPGAPCDGCSSCSSWCCSGPKADLGRTHLPLSLQSYLLDPEILQKFVNHRHNGGLPWSLYAPIAILNWGHSAYSPKAFKLHRRCIRIIVYFRDIGILNFQSIYILHPKLP